VTLQLSIRVLSSELPLDGSSLGVSVTLPRFDLGLQALPGWNTTVQALAAEDADLDLRHVQPTRMLGRVVELHPAHQPVPVVMVVPG
jgi:hypothetical protein